LLTIQKHDLLRLGRSPHIPHFEAELLNEVESRCDPHLEQRHIIRYSIIFSGIVMISPVLGFLPFLAFLVKRLIDLTKGDKS
jgi:uncharacterized membrane protein YhaH (DUF805 family)